MRRTCSFTSSTIGTSAAARWCSPPTAAPVDPGPRPADADLAQAIVDRVLERGRLLQLDGPSMRTKHLALDAPATVEPPLDQGVRTRVRTSGKRWSEFPEPRP
jgi:hypothetical protein